MTSLDSVAPQTRRTSRVSRTNLSMRLETGRRRYGCHPGSSRHDRPSAEARSISPRANIALRGSRFRRASSFEGRSAAAFTSSGVHACTLLGYSGKNTSGAASDPALLTLSPGSGIRGFDVVYPEQGYGSAAAPVLPYPFTIRGTGAGVWVENVTVANAYNLIDFASFRCDDHFVSGVEATVLNTGILVGGGSEGGRLERVLISRGIYEGYRCLSEPPRMERTRSPRTRARTRFPSSSEAARGRPRSAWTPSTSRSVGRCSRMEGAAPIRRSGSPLRIPPLRPGYLFEGGDNLRFVGVAAGSSDGTSFVSSASFTGSVDVYGTMSWGNCEIGTFRAAFSASTTSEA